MNKISFFLLSLSFPAGLLAQSSSTDQQTDSSGLLRAVEVKAYEQNRKLTEVGAAIGLVGQSQLNRFSNTNILPAVNTIPGVRMEERSPASYRLNIRGSSIRSPFGVRDIKIYFNEIPLTDPGGNTYLNQLSFYNMQSLEIIKGPAGSLYGAGIGGAVLIRSMPSPWEKGISVDVLGGSYGLNAVNVNARFGEESHQNSINYSYQAADGYRVQSNMRRDVASLETLIKSSEKQSIHAYMLYSDLYYQTPGGLNLKEYTADPRQARPAAGTSPSAVQNKASIYQKIFTVGISDEYHFSGNWKNTTSVYGAYADFTNPGIRVYEIRKEPQFGGRTVFQYVHAFSGADLQINFGAEAQKGFFNTADYKNNQGVSDSLQTNDNINNWQYMIFAQADLKLRHGWFITAGASFNKSSVQFERLSIVPPTLQTQTFENKIDPRIAILKKLGSISVYANAGKGFSTPTVAELLHSNTLNPNLQPEDAVDYEIGTRGNLFSGKLYFDVNAFFLQLKNTIVQRIDTNNVFYFVNAGETRQNGIETYLSFLILDHPRQAISNLKIWTSFTWHNFHYEDFKQVNNDYSGNQLPGVAPHVFVAGLDLYSGTGLYANLNYTYSDRIALNDANADFASSFNLFGARIGWQKIFSGPRLKLEIFLGGDNLFNAKYSLGNDINAAAGRYYNAAATANYYAGLSISHFFH
ncbi:MAG: TonB-dependent receptor [Chitinophagales bacterium]